MSTQAFDPRRLLAGQVWAISDGGLAALEARLELAARGVPMPEAAVDRRGRHVAANGAAMIRIHGPLTPRETWLSQWLGGTSYDVVRAQVREALADRDVDAILLDIDSPGGSVEGVEETATLLRSARAKKPVIAAVAGLAASAAYYLASQASEIHASPSAAAGSIGVVMLHLDVSKLDADIGLKFSYVYAGRHKVEANPHEPLADDTRAHLQRDWINPAYRQFVNAVALGRKIAASTVESRFGQGRVYVAEEALSRGMVDHVTPFDDVVGDVLGRGPIVTRLVRRALVDAATLEHEQMRRWVELKEMELAVEMANLPDNTARS